MKSRIILLILIWGSCFSGQTGIIPEGRANGNSSGLNNKLACKGFVIPRMSSGISIQCRNQPKYFQHVVQNAMYDYSPQRFHFDEHITFDG